ncbi:MAG: DUF1552 domain-containing protein [Lentisphaeraceae bacterium]|nr:DUF1552 domain-containing protein [Lentisphaeraceae bacterium]
MSFKLNRRSALKGLGVALPLPFLNAMATPKQKETPKRFLALFKPNGVHPPTWAINNGKENEFELSALMKPLTPHKQDLLVLDNMGTKLQAGHNGYNFLCGNGRPREASVDQVLAKHLGKNTPLKSLELTTEGIFTNKADCSYISYDEKGRFVPRESDPQLVFDKLFRSPMSNKKRRQEMTSILDGVKDNAGFLERRVGKEDNQTLDEFYTMVRETEKKLEARRKLSKLQKVDTSTFKRPTTGGNLDSQVTAMMDIIALAFLTDSTRVSSYMLGNDNSRLVFDFLGVNEQHHWLSHFFRNFSIGNITKLNKINLWHTQKFAYMLSKLKSFKEGENTLLDNTVVMFGSGMGHSDVHSGNRIPTILAGGKGLIKTGRYVNHQEGQSVTGLHLSLLHQFGIQQKTFQRKTDTLPGLNDSNYEHFVQKKIATYLKEEKNVIKLQGSLRLSTDINTPRLHLMDIEGKGTVKIEIPFGNFNKVNLAFYCGKDVYIEGKGKQESGRWNISSISKISELK